MTYQVHIKKNVIKILAQTNEPQYSALKKAIYDLAENLRPFGYKKLRNREGFRYELEVIELFTRFLIKN